MVIPPSSEIYLIKSPLELSEHNQLDFETPEAQENYFKSLPKIELEKYTYQRKDGILRAEVAFDEVVEYNYCLYKNSAHGDKIYYAFIDDIAYSSDKVSLIKLKTDVFQTYYFDVEAKPSFIEREHVNDDTIGVNTVPENLETGEPIVNSLIKQDIMSPASLGGIGYFITFLVSDISPLSITEYIAKCYGGVYGGYFLVGVKNITDAERLQGLYEESQKADAIREVFICPEWLYGTYRTFQPQIFDFLLYFPQVIRALVANDSQDKSVNVPGRVDGYSPKNNKLFTYPFSYIFATNNAGEDVIYHYEDFNDPSDIKFRMSGIISQGCQIKTYPLKYRRQNSDNNIYGIKASKLPICSWNSDAYKIWLAQNELNVQSSTAVSLASGVLGVASSALSSNTGGAISSGLNVLETVRSNLVEHYYAERLPNQARGNINSSDYNFSGSKFFEFRKMSVKAEYAKIIDDYFSMFGYQVNRVKLPNLKGRRNWNFVKTVNCYFKGDIPQRDMEEFKNLFNNGITIWHNSANFCNYSANNDII